MLSITSYLHDYIVENAEFFNEFDRSNFIANASLALDRASGELSRFGMHGSHYSNILNKTITHINDIEIDSYAIAEFVTKVLNSGRVDSAKLLMKDITEIDNIIIKPQYLTEAISNYKEVINGIASGKYDTSKIKNFYTTIDSYTDTLKKRLVSSDININITPKEMLNHSISDKIEVTTKYLEDRVLSFLQAFLKKKKELINEMTIVRTTVNSALSDLNKLIEDIDVAIELNKIDDVKKKLMLNYTYNQVRAILEAVSFMTYATIRKAHQFEECVVECQNTYNSLTLIFNDAMNIVESGVFDTKVITATDANNMVEKLVNGGNDVFAELSHNIIQYHKGYLSTHTQDTDVLGGDVDSFVSTLLSNSEYNTDIYHDLVKVYIEIGNGLDIIAKHVDDRFIIFDEIVQKAGFILGLSDRFHNEVEALANLSNYNITDLEIGDNKGKTDSYYRILSEINDYPNLTKQIAEAAKEVYIKAEYVEELFSSEKNDELSSSETINELKIFFESFKDQFRELNCDVVKGLYTRLKELATKADNCLESDEQQNDISYDNNFFGEAVLATLQELNEVNDIIMETMLKEYYSEREFKERGVRLVYEADENTSVKVVNTGDATSTTSPATGTGNKITSEKLSGILKGISEWFEKMINSFEEVIGRQKAKNTKWLAENKDELIGRSYSNVEIQILPYDKMPSSQITGDISKMTNNVSAMTTQNMQNIYSYEDMRAKLINFGPKFTQNVDEKVAIVNYYKVGNAPLQTVSYANSNIKTLVVNEMIPYCEAYYDSYKEEIKKQLTALKGSMENIHKTYVSESANELNTRYQIFTEAEETAQQSTTKVQGQTAATPAQQPTTQNQNKASGLSEKSGWVKRCVQNYSGCILNAIRDRNNDYFKVLNALVPKAIPSVAKAETPKSEEVSDK